LIVFKNFLFEKTSSGGLCRTNLTKGFRWKTVPDFIKRLHALPGGVHQVAKYNYQNRMVYGAKSKKPRIFRGFLSTIR